MERVLVRSLDLRPTWSLVFEIAPTVPITATVARAILGDRVPAIAWDDSGPDGELVFPGTPDGYRLAKVLRDQLHEAIAENVDARRAQAEACPAESFPEPGAPDVDADDFAEPAGGEGARVAAEEAAWEAQIRAAVTTPSALDPVEIDHHLYGGWRPLDRFVVNDPDDAARFFAASHLWPTWGAKASGTVITRCDVHVSGHEVTAGLLIECEGLRRPTAVSARLLSACARRVTA